MYSPYIYVQNTSNVQNIEGFYNLLKKLFSIRCLSFGTPCIRQVIILSLSNFVNSLQNPQGPGLHIM
jgi:hypothetical protein